MAGTILVKELGTHIDEPAPPQFYSQQGQAAWRRGFTARCWRGEKASNPYTRRFMRRAWMAGWDVAHSRIEIAKARA